MTLTLNAPNGAIEDTNGNELVRFHETASAVNELGVRNAATGNAPALVATGDDTDINLNLVPKGGGRVTEDGVAVALETAVDGAPDLAAGEENTNAIHVALQVVDAGGSQIHARRVMRVWIGDAAFGAECTTAPNGGVAIDTGTVLQTVTANKHYVIISDATGLAEITLTESSAKTFYVMAEVGGRVAAVEVAFA